MANNCHFTYVDFMTPEEAASLKEKLSAFQGSRGDEFSTIYGVRLFISKPLGTRAEVGGLSWAPDEQVSAEDFVEDALWNYDLSEEDIENGKWKETLFGDKMVLVVVDGWERWSYPEELWGLGISPYCVWQEESDDRIHFVPGDGYKPSDDFTSEDNEGYLEEYFDVENDKVYFKVIKNVLDKLAPEIPAPYYQILSEEELSDFAQSTHLWLDEGKNYPAVNPKTGATKRMISDKDVAFFDKKLSEANDILNEGGVISSFEGENEANAFQQELVSAAGTQNEHLSKKKSNNYKSIDLQIFNYGGEEVAYFKLNNAEDVRRLVNFLNEKHNGANLLDDCFCNGCDLVCNDFEERVGEDKERPNIPVDVNYEGSIMCFDDSDCSVIVNPYGNSTTIDLKDMDDVFVSEKELSKKGMNVMNVSIGYKIASKGRMKCALRVSTDIKKLWANYVLEIPKDEEFDINKLQIPVSPYKQNAGYIIYDGKIEEMVYGFEMCDTYPNKWSVYDENGKEVWSSLVEDWEDYEWQSDYYGEGEDEDDEDEDNDFDFDDEDEDSDDEGDWDDDDEDEDSDDEDSDEDEDDSDDFIFDDDDDEEDDDEAEIYDVVVVPGNKTITAAKFLRDRLEMKLSEANDLLNEGGVIASFEDEDEAKAFQQEFASAGGVAICLKRE